MPKQSLFLSICNVCFLQISLILILQFWIAIIRFELLFFLTHIFETKNFIFFCSEINPQTNEINALSSLKFMEEKIMKKIWTCSFKIKKKNSCRTYILLFIRKQTREKHLESLYQSQVRNSMKIHLHKLFKL